MQEQEEQESREGRRKRRGMIRMVEDEEKDMKEEMEEEEEDKKEGGGKKNGKRGKEKDERQRTREEEEEETRELVEEEALREEVEEAPGLEPRQKRHCRSEGGNVTFSATDAHPIADLTAVHICFDGSFLLEGVDVAIDNKHALRCQFIPTVHAPVYWGPGSLRSP
ncbi:hypothetical protein PoB_004951900 [Plakobranchus ocellatus]|uniref:Uncharacterized protein n=1 Tax=Plakobranchus ocellatus TaxID=259542 RepID=A0AAV4BS58_9GAST|nr:hypothetical protein PoB_004951900 [Plakobranchus ocellatus]